MTPGITVQMVFVTGNDLDNPANIPLTTMMEAPAN